MTLRPARAYFAFASPDGCAGELFGAGADGAAAAASAAERFALLADFWTPLAFSADPRS